MFEIVVFFVDELGALLTRLVLYPLLVDKLAHGLHMAVKPGLLHDTKLHDNHHHIHQNLEECFRNHGELVALGVILRQPCHADAQQQHADRRERLELVVEIVLAVF